MEGKVQINKQQKIRKVGVPGQVLGQLEILYNLPKRIQNAVSLTKVSCLVLRKQILQKLLANKDLIRQKMRYGQRLYFEVIQFDQQLQQHQKKSISLYLKKKKFSKDEQIFRQGALIDDIIFILSGILAVINIYKVTRKIKLYQSSNYQIMNNNKIIQLQINRLYQGDSFGQYQVTNKKITKQSIKAITQGQYFALPYKELLKSLPNIFNFFKSKSNIYPPDHIILKKYEDELLQQIMKNKLKKKMGQKKCSYQYNNCIKEYKEFQKIMYSSYSQNYLETKNDIKLPSFKKTKQKEIKKKCNKTQTKFPQIQILISYGKKSIYKKIKQF